MEHVAGRVSEFLRKSPPIVRRDGTMKSNAGSFTEWETNGTAKRVLVFLESANPSFSSVRQGLTRAHPFFHKSSFKENENIAQVAQAESTCMKKFPACGRA
jgi:hypothetical protein